MRVRLVMSLGTLITTLGACDALLDIHDPAAISSDGGEDAGATYDGDDAVSDSPLDTGDAGLWAPVPISARITRLADVTGDGKADLVVVRDDGSVDVSASDGTRFAEVVWSSPAITPPCGSVTGCTSTTKVLDFADVTGDGKSDAVLVSSSGMFVYTSTGSGFASGLEWSRETGGTYKFSTLNQSAATQFADMDGDGDADVVEISDVTYVLLSSRLDFGPPLRWTNVPYAGDIATSFTDVTGDGKADCVGIEQSSGIFALPSSGSFCEFGPDDASQAYWYSWIDQNDIRDYWGNAGNFFADVNGDGKADLLTVKTTASSGTTIPEFGSQGTFFTLAARPWFSTGRTTLIELFGDVDGDAKKRADLVTIDLDGVHAYLSDGSRFVVP